MKKNGEQIYEKLNEDFRNENISKKLIYDILNTLRRYITHYTKDVYQIENISSENKMETFAVDESLFFHLDNQQLLVIGIINTITKKFRIQLSFTRNATLLKNINQKHIKRGNVVVSDAWERHN